jgi:hypothetical protein
MDPIQVRAISVDLALKMMALSNNKAGRPVRAGDLVDASKVIYTFLRDAK